MAETDTPLERAKLIYLAENTPADEATLRLIFPADIVDEALKWRKLRPPPPSDRR